MLNVITYEQLICISHVVQKNRIIYNTAMENRSFNKHVLSLKQISNCQIQLFHI